MASTEEYFTTDVTRADDGLSVRPWADLFPELLEQIMELMSHVDLLHSSTVCKAWHSVVMENRNRLPYLLPMCHCQFGKLSLPLLLRSSSRESIDPTEFLCLSDKKVYGEFLLSELRNKRIGGSSKGWLVLLGIQDDAIHLLNPLTRTQILLPPMPSFSWFSRGQLLEDWSSPFKYVCKAILSSDPTTSSSNCIVMAIVSQLGMLSFCRLGEDKWINIENSKIRMDDVIYYNGKFYATNDKGEVLSIEDIGSIAKFKVMAPVPEDVEGRGDPSRYYLVESSRGELLLVSRREEEVVDIIYTKSTIGFDVFKLELDCLHVEGAPTYMWIRVESLDEEMIFLGNGCSVCIPSSLYPQCKGNCIYFTDDDFDHQIGNITLVLEGEDSAEKVYHDNGIYDLANGSILPLDTDDSCSHLPPVWLTPNPWR